MADDNKRPFRANESYSRPPAGAAGGSDPLAELARLIGQTDPFSEFGRDGRRAGGAPPPQQAAAPIRNTPSVQNYGADQFGAPDNRDPRRFSAQPGLPQPFGEQQFVAGPDLYRTGFENPAMEHYQPAGYDASAYYQDAAASAAHADDAMYDDVPPSRRRISVITIAAIFALAVIGTAGAFGYRALFGSSGSTPPPVIKADTAPSKIVPSTNDQQSNKLITDRVGDRGQGEKLVSREERPIDLMDKPSQSVFPGMPTASTPLPAAAMPASASAAGEPKKIRTIAIRPDQLTGGTADATPPPAPSRAAAKPAPAPRATADAEDARQAQAPGPTPIRQIPARSTLPPANAPLSLSPDAAPAAAPAPVRAATAPVRIAPQAAAPAGPSGSYLVQLSSQRSEADAQSTFRALQGKFPAQLGNRQAVIRRADLGDKGTYYRAMVGPFANAGEASELCSSLKSAGGQCIVQRN